MRTLDLGSGYVLHVGDCMDAMRAMADNSIDAIVCDPPYGLSPDGKARTWDDIAELRAQGKGPRGGFMGRAWDAAVPGVTWARECLRVLKPGGHLIAFSSTRTSGRLMCALEDGGFEIRDTIHWLHYQGFPKSLDISKAIDKAAGIAPDRVIENDDASLGGFAKSGWNTTPRQLIYDSPSTDDAKRWHGWGTAIKPAIEPAILARKPLSEKTVAANVLRWGTGAINVDACRYAEGDRAWPGPDTNRGDDGCWPANVYHCPKPSRREREAGTEHLAGLSACDVTGRKEGSAGSKHARAGRTAMGQLGNHHPTVKPVTLMRWLVRMVCPPGGVVLDPFAGSGTTIAAGAHEGIRVHGIELSDEYVPIIEARVRYAIEHPGSMGSPSAESQSAAKRTRSKTSRKS